MEGAGSIDFSATRENVMRLFNRMYTAITKVIVNGHPSKKLPNVEDIKILF